MGGSTHIKNSARISWYMYYAGEALTCESEKKMTRHLEIKALISYLL